MGSAPSGPNITVVRFASRSTEADGIHCRFMPAFPRVTPGAEPVLVED